MTEKINLTFKRLVNFKLGSPDWIVLSSLPKTSSDRSSEPIKQGSDKWSEHTVAFLMLLARLNSPMGLCNVGVCVRSTGVVRTRGQNRWNRHLRSDESAIHSRLPHFSMRYGVFRPFFFKFYQARVRRVTTHPLMKVVGTSVLEAVLNPG